MRRRIYRFADKPLHLLIRNLSKLGLLEGLICLKIQDLAA
jgi:hypothetical protein